MAPESPAPQPIPSENSNSEASDSKPLWSGRFQELPDPAAVRYSQSLDLDRRLAIQDLKGSRTHVRMLARQGILDEQVALDILSGLDQIELEIQGGTFPFREELEDIHMNIEHRLQELIGESGRELHAGRSRNDQVSLDSKLYTLELAGSWETQLVQIQTLLVRRAEALTSQLLPAWTHLQAAQPISWAFYLLAFCEMFNRDRRRLRSYRHLNSVSPLGAAALAGSSLPLDPDWSAANLGLRTRFENSYDVVGDRDFILELAQIASQIMLHLSRLAEDFVYFSSTAVQWIRLPESFCTGSSMMPQKRNPDVMELMRGKAASVLGHCTALGTLLKGLPSSYHRDLQQDKQHLFNIADSVTASLEVAQGVLAGFQLNDEKIQADLSKGFLTATELAEELVAKGVPFRTAHRRVGEFVASQQARGLEQANEEDLSQAFPECGPSVRELLKPQSVLSRHSYRGSTGRDPVSGQIRSWDRKLRSQRIVDRWLEVG